MSDIFTNTATTAFPTVIRGDTNNMGAPNNLTNQSEIQLNIERIKSPASSSNTSIAEYISIQSSSVTNPSSPLFTENSSSTTTTNSSNNNNNNNGPNTIPKTIINTSTSNLSTHLMNGKPIIFNSVINNTNNNKDIGFSTSIDSSITIEPIPLDLNKDLFYCIDRQPASPPNYDDVNPVKTIKYPIFENVAPVIKDTKPPKYTPTINKFTIASLKMERISPYEPSTSRSWKDFIIEINSTQLNFYFINDTLTNEIKRLKYTHTRGQSTSIDPDNDNDTTNNTSKSKKSNSIFSMISKEPTSLDLDEIDQEKIASYLCKNQSKFIIPSNLFKSYTLQYAKYGIPIDYDKKPFVLRLRCESEQFLISFSHIDDMIMWSMYLSMGISVALDLDFRELPNYRVVPRRRRRRGRRRRSATGNRNRNRRRGHRHNYNLGTNNGLVRRGHDILETTGFTPTTTTPIQNKSRSYSLTSMRSGLNPINFQRSSTSIEPSSNENVRIPSNLNEIGKILSIPNNSDMKSISNNVSNLSLSPSSTRYDSNNHSRSNSSSGLNLSFKSKMKSLFKSSKTLSGSAGSSNRPKNTIKFGSFVGRTNSSSYVNSNNTYSRNRSMSTPVITGNDSKSSRSQRLDNRTMGTFSIRTPTSTADKRAKERKITQSVINEIHEHHRSRGRSNNTVDDSEEEDEEENDDDDDDDDNDYYGFNSTDDHITDGETEEEEDAPFDGTREHTSIFAQEGLLEEQEEEDDDDNDDDDASDGMGNASNNRPRSNTGDSVFSRRVYNLSSIGYASYESDDVKWTPEKKEMSRRRYIRDSLRCIRPFVEDQEWIGHIVFRPSKEPRYKTNNPPIWIGNSDGKRRFKYISSSDFSNVKNHYLKAYVVGPVGFLKAETKVVATPMDLPL